MPRNFINFKMSNGEDKEEFVFMENEEEDKIDICKRIINDIYEKSHELLKAYCNLTDEDIAGLPDMSQADILTLITRRSFE